MNPMLKKLTSQQSLPNNLGQVKNLMNMVRGSANPQAMLNQLMQTNPQLKGVMDMVQKSGGNPKTAFYELAKQKGVDPNQILNMLK